MPPWYRVYCNAGFYLLASCKQLLVRPAAGMMFRNIRFTKIRNPFSIEITAVSHRGHLIRSSRTTFPSRGRLLRAAANAPGGPEGNNPSAASAAPLLAQGRLGRTPARQLNSGRSGGPSPPKWGKTIPQSPSSTAPFAQGSLHCAAAKLREVRRAEPAEPHGEV